MRKTNDTFMPSVVLDDIYEYLTDKVFVAANEDIYYHDIVTGIIELLDNHRHNKVLCFTWEEYLFPDEETGLFIVAWREPTGPLRLEHFRFTKYYEGDFE